MIVSCPACQTQFNVDPALLGPDGRKVRCAKCAHVWRVGRDGRTTPAGQFGLHAPNPAAAGTAAAQADADVRPAPQGPQDTGAPGAGSAEATGSPDQDSQDDEAADKAKTVGASEDAAGPDVGQAALVDAASSQAKRQKGGKKFKTFLLLLCLVVLALFAAATVTGQFGSGAP
jgi:predicted Zn finger-like uncharacterized protein